MNNQLTKFEDGKIIKKENVSEEQLINKLYQYERLGTVGKIKSKFKELEVNDDIWHSQCAMARAEEEYLKIQLNDYKERYENIKREFDFSIRFREINQGLKEQCRKYKLQLEEKDKTKERILKNWNNSKIQQKRLYDELKLKLTDSEKEIENIKSKFCKDCRKCIQKRYVDCAFQNFDNEYCGDLETIINKSIKHQKINFAIEKLDKVKETTENVLDNALKNSSLNQSYYDRLLDEIDKQIKQLKEG